MDPLGRARGTRATPSSWERGNWPGWRENTALLHNVPERNKQTIILRGGVSSHFIFLEMAMGKKYAIINPTLIKMAPGIVRGWKAVIGK